MKSRNLTVDSEIDISFDKMLASARSMPQHPSTHIQPLPNALILPGRPEESKTHLVKALQQAHDAALDLLLVERTAGAVKPHTLEALDLGDDDGGGSGAGGSDGESCHGGGSGGDAGDGSEDGGTEHGCGDFGQVDLFNWWGWREGG